MRVVGGRHRGRRLEAPEGLAVRPTADRTREALFNILTRGKLSGEFPGQEPATEPGQEPNGALTGLRVLDAFAGTGALGLEALSRGAAQVTFMESQAAALETCRTNIRALAAQADCELIRCDVLRPPPASAPCALILMDPPYGQGLAAPALKALDAAGWLFPGALVAVELLANETFAPPHGFEPLDERKYGKARIVFLRAPD